MHKSENESVPGAIILCGGRSTRMGADKAGLLFDGEALLTRVCRLTAVATNPVVVVAASDQRLPQLPNHVSIVHDEVSGQGPVSGIMTGLRHLTNLPGATATTWIGSCDLPFVDVDVIRNLHQQLADSPAICVRHGDRIHPLSAIYRTNVADKIGRLFDDGERRAARIPQLLDARIVTAKDAGDESARFLFNVNSPTDLNVARAML